MYFLLIETCLRFQKPSSMDRAYPQTSANELFYVYPFELFVFRHPVLVEPVPQEIFTIVI